MDYQLTPLGEALGEAVCGIWTWVEQHLKDVERSRQPTTGGPAAWGCASDGRRCGSELIPLLAAAIALGTVLLLRRSRSGAG